MTHKQKEKKMKQIIKSASYLIALAFLAFSTQGCLLLAAGAGAAGGVYLANKTERVFDAHFEKAYNATKNTFKKKNWSLLKSRAAKIFQKMILSAWKMITAEKIKIESDKCLTSS